MRFLPILAIGGGAALLMASRGKKKGTQPSLEDLEENEDAEVAASGPAPSGIRATSQTEELQEILHALGYGAIVGTIDGRKGRKTKAGITAFQSDYSRWPGARNSLGVDGAWGPNTSAAADHALRALKTSSFSTFPEMVNRSGGITGTSGPTPRGDSSAITEAEERKFLGAIFDEISQCLARGEVQKSSSGIYGTVSNYAKAAQCLFNFLARIGANISQMTEPEKEFVTEFIQEASKSFMGALDGSGGNVSTMSKSEWVSRFRNEIRRAFNRSRPSLIASHPGSGYIELLFRAADPETWRWLGLDGRPG